LVCDPDRDDATLDCEDPLDLSDMVSMVCTER
jgi:hypothetical protein